MRLPTPREPRHGSSRWEVIRYALGSNARTARLCVIWVVVTGGPVAGRDHLLDIAHPVTGSHAQPGRAGSSRP